MSKLKVYNFDCNGWNSPAYSCNYPDDNSGQYYKKEDIDRILYEMSQCECICCVGDRDEV